MNPHALTHGGSGNPQRIVERMQMQCSWLEQRLVVACAMHPLLHLRGIQPLPMAVEVLRQQALPRDQYRAVAKPVGPQHTGVARIAVDRVLRYPFADQCHRIGGAAIQRLGASRPEFGQQAVFATAEAGEHETAIAPGSAKTGRLRIEHDHLANATLGQPERRVQAGKTGADHACPGCMLAR